MKAFSIMVALSFMAILSVLTFLGILLWGVFALYASLSILTFFMYWKDKTAARKDHQRTPENTLHILAVCGGWPGALIGQQTLRHKTQKVSFRWVLWLTVLINAGLLLGLYSYFPASKIAVSGWNAYQANQNPFTSSSGFPFSPLI